MSLAIVILFDSAALVLTDSRSTASDLSSYEDGAKKTAVLSFDGNPAIVAFTGDGEIDGRLTLDVLRESAFRKEADNVSDSILRGLKSAFEADVANTCWANSLERETYQRDAKVVLHVLTSPKDHSIYEVTPTRIQQLPFPAEANISCSGVTRVGSLAQEYRLWSLESVQQLVVPCIEDICTTEPTCGYPIDVTLWRIGGEPETTRCSDLSCLQTYFIRLAL